LFLIFFLEEENALNDINSTFIECGHAFHSNCLQIWIGKSHNCPICRLKITGYLNNIDIKERTTSRRSLSNKSTVISDFNEEQDFEEFLLGVQKVIHSNMSNISANTRYNAYIENFPISYFSGTKNSNNNNNINDDSINSINTINTFNHNNLRNTFRENFERKDSNINSN